MTAEKGGFYYERTHRFRADLQDVLSAYQGLYYRKMHEAKQTYHCISSLPHLAILARADSELCPSTSRQADREESVDVDYPSALMDSDDDEMLIDDSLPLSLNTSVSCTSHDLIL